MWYRTGTISVTNGSTAVTGSGTAWIANAGVGEAIYGPDGRLYEIAAIVSNTSITLASNYLGSTQSAQAYVIVPSQSYIRDLANQAAELINSYAETEVGIGQGIFPDGSISAPALRFGSDLTTGLYRSATNEVTFVANGVAQFKFNASGVTFLNGINATDLTLTGNTTLGNASGDTVTVNAGTMTFVQGTANQVQYLDSNKKIVGNSNLVFDGTNLSVSGSNVLRAANIGTTVQAYDADLTAWSGKTAPTGTVVGTSDSQALSNKSFGDNPTLSAGTANGVAYLNGSKVLTTGSALTFNGTTLTLANDASIHGLTVGLGGGSVSTNTANGFQALFNNTTASNNTANGFQALLNNTTGYNNTANGFQALLFNTTGYNNTANGLYALLNNTTGYNNTANGIYALLSNTTGYNNTANGFQALYSNTTGAGNTANGLQALFNNTTGSGNTAINPLNSAGSYAPVFDPTTENNRFCMGSTGVTNAYIQVAWTVVSDARDKTDFATVPHGLDFVTKLSPTAYRYKMSRDSVEGHGPVRYGFKAQDVLALEGDNPVIVDAEDADKLRFNDQSMLAVLVNAIKELNAKIEAQAAEIKLLKGL